MIILYMIMIMVMIMALLYMHFSASLYPRKRLMVSLKRKNLSGYVTYFSIWPFMVLMMIEGL